jgi:hypothetical protein
MGNVIATKYLVTLWQGESPLETFLSTNLHPVPFSCVVDKYTLFVPFGIADLPVIYTGLGHGLGWCFRVARACGGGGPSASREISLKAYANR